MKRSGLRWRSKKAAKRESRTALFRFEILKLHPRCMICGCNTKYPHKLRPAFLSKLCCHEIAAGSDRHKARGKPFATLVLCWHCNQSVVTDNVLWPRAAQLALLKRKLRACYDLAAFNELVGFGPNRITEDEVNAWVEAQQEGRPVP